MKVSLQHFTCYRLKLSRVTDGLQLRKANIQNAGHAKCKNKQNTCYPVFFFFDSFCNRISSALPPLDPTYQKQYCKENHYMLNRMVRKINNFSVPLYRRLCTCLQHAQDSQAKAKSSETDQYYFITNLFNLYLQCSAPYLPFHFTTAVISCRYCWNPACSFASFPTTECFFTGSFPAALWRYHSYSISRLPISSALYPAL